MCFNNWQGGIFTGHMTCLSRDKVKDIGHCVNTERDKLKEAGGVITRRLQEENYECSLAAEGNLLAGVF